jgi:DNA-binding transcriptional regulator YiaG
MSDLLQSLKTEITRLSRKEIKAAITPLQESNAKLKKTVVELKVRISELEKKNRLDKSTYRKGDILEGRNLSESPEEPARLRITPKVIFNLRKKLGLPREAFAQLLGVSAQTVYSLEKKNGKIRLRSATLSKYLAVRELGKREAHKKLGELNHK